MSSDKLANYEPLALFFGGFSVANTQSAIKRIRSSQRKRERNRVYRTQARTYIKRTRKLVAEERFDEAREVARLASSTLDRAASKGIIHQNNAARRKSRLMHLIAQAEQQAE
jgi:small subunit ribosomal protein S20